MKKIVDIPQKISDLDDDNKKVQKYRQEAKDYEQKYAETKLFPSLARHQDKSLHAVHVFRHVVFEIFIRGKYLHRATLQAIRQEDAYSGFTLLKAYWETAGMMGYAYISGERLFKAKDYRGLSNWAVKHGLGGKNYPTPDMLAERGYDPDEFKQTNVITMMESLDRDFNHRIAKGKKVSEFAQHYKEFIGEAGHPTYIGLSICEDKIETIHGTEIIPNPSKSWKSDDLIGLLNYVSTANLMMFHYWENLSKSIDDEFKLFES